MKSWKGLCGLALAIVGGVFLAGCFGEMKKVHVTNGAEEETAELVWYLAGNEQKDQELVFEEVNKRLKEDLNTTVKFCLVSEDLYENKMKSVIASGTPFDMCFTSSWMNVYTMNVYNGAFLSLDELLLKYGPHIMEQVPESYWDAVRVDGNIYGVINYQIMAKILGVSFPEDVVEAVGYDISKVKSYKDLGAYFEAVKKKEPEMIPFLGFLGKEMPQLFTEDTSDPLAYIQGPLAVRSGAPEKAVNVIETPEFMDFCRMVREWYQKGYVRRDASSIKDEVEERRSHRYAAFLTGVGSGSPQVVGDQVGYPVVQAQTVPAFVDTGSIQAALTAISSGSKHPDKAMQVLDYLFANPEIYNMLCYGLEGKHYQQMEDGTVKEIPDGGYNPVIPWQFGSWFNAKLLQGQALDHWEQVKKVNETAWVSPVLGFVYDSRKWKKEVVQIKSLLQERLPGLLSGSVDPEKEIPDLIGKLDHLKIKEIMKDMDAQLSKWRKMKK